MSPLKKLKRLNNVRFGISSSLSNEDIDELVAEFGELFWEGRFELEFLEYKLQFSSSNSSSRSRSTSVMTRL